MPQYLEVAVNVPQVTGVFTYHLPPELQDQVQAGQLLVVPFGKQSVYGVAVRFVQAPPDLETRPVLELGDPAAALTPQQLALAQHLASTCLAPLAACTGLMLPPGLAQQADTLYSLEERGEGGGEGSSPTPLPSPLSPGFNETQARLLDLLKRRGPLRGGQIDQVLRRVNWKAEARLLARRGVLQTRAVLPPPRVHPKLVRTARLACPPEKAEAALPALAREGSAALARRQAMLRFLLREPGEVEVTWLYAESGGGSLADLEALAERDLVVLGESETFRDPLRSVDFQPAGSPILTEDQAGVWAEIQPRLQAAARGEAVAPVLLHGVTGSGKTEIYLRAVAETLALGRQAIVLVPEIALTPQTVRRFLARFPGQVGLLHSGLSDGERYDTWRRARAGAIPLIVGPRSALFAPLERLGLIVVDECHDDSYYQSDLPPNYHAREAAVAYARLAGAVCLLGSATPDVVSAYRAGYQASPPGQAAYFYLHLPERILAHKAVVQAQMESLAAAGLAPEPPSGQPGQAQTPPASPASQTGRFRPLQADAQTIDLPPVRLVDMRQELMAGNRSIFSTALHAALEQVLARSQQAILFLNRRGSATYVFCRACGYILKCPRCNLPLTYHAPRAAEPAGVLDGQASKDPLRCHYCGYVRGLPHTCPECGSPQIRHMGTGTERVEAEVQALFPQARILRWDYETTRTKGAHEIILSHFANRRADVLIGTQMLAKGLDLPLVTLVGVILADVGLALPDYRTSERTFQVLTQVAGRAGRSPLGGEVILQTFLPNHYAIQAASRHDYAGFYAQELAYRRQLGYPPFAQLARLEFRHTNQQRAESAAQGMAANLRTLLAGQERHATQMIGPAPCFFSRLGGEYRWQIILRGPDPRSLLEGRALGDCRVEINPPSLL